MDSNHRSYKQQIYSLSPLATREIPHIHFRSLEPVDGLEPPTCSLQVSCSSSCAIPAYSRLFFLVRQFKRLFQNISCCMSLYLSYIILYKNFFKKSKSRKNPVLESSQTYSVRAETSLASPHTTNLSYTNLQQRV